MSDTPTIILGSGCFWCSEAVFLGLKGVISVMPGYSGGNLENPTYEQVCSGKTGHVEVVKVEFNPQDITLKDILEVFFVTHDPTQVGGQGHDSGSQYRSVIFYDNAEQKQAAETIIADLESQKIFVKPIVTEVKPAGEFYAAEDYHKNYYQNHPDQAYCRGVINPKLAKLKEKFGYRLK